MFLYNHEFVTLRRLLTFQILQPHTVPSTYQKKKSAGDKNSSSDKKSKSESTPKEEKRKRSSVKEIDTRLEETPESVSCVFYLLY